MDLVLKQTKKGKGVFANKNFSKGETITVFKGKILDYDEIVDHSYEDEHCIQIGERTYLGPSGKLDDFINHSCNPNSGIKIIKRKLVLIAIRDIKKDEEIRWDYSTYMDENHWEMDCNCQSKNCRKRIRDFKYLPKKIQQKHIRLGIVPKYILKNLKRDSE